MVYLAKVIVDDTNQEVIVKFTVMYGVAVHNNMAGQSKFESKNLAHREINHSGMFHFCCSKQMSHGSGVKLV